MNYLTLFLKTQGHNFENERKLASLIYKTDKITKRVLSSSNSFSLDELHSLKDPYLDKHFDIEYNDFVFNYINLRIDNIDM